MSKEFEYYIPHRINDDSIPLLDEDDDCPEYLYQEFPISSPELMLFTLGDPIPRKPKMADYLTSSDTIISEKIYNVLKPLNIEGIQLLPAKITGKRNEVFLNYWAVHIYNVIKCVDPSLSDCVFDNDILRYVEKIILSKNILKGIPLKNRLIFRLREDWSFQLFHVSIVEKIMSVNPSGVKFTDVEKWNEGTLFED